MKNYKSYKNYSDAFDKNRKKFISLGYKVLGAKKYTPMEYEAQYIALRNDKRMAKAEGRKTSFSHLPEELAKNQFSIKSSAQAKSIQKAILKSGGKKITQREIMYNINYKGSDELWDAIRERRKELFAQKWTAEEVRLAISAEFFESD